MKKPNDLDPEMIAQALVGGFRVLQAFTAPEPELTLDQVAHRAGLDTGTTFHFVQTLVLLGYVERIAGSKQFRLTLKPLELGFHAIVQNLDAFPHCPRLDNSASLERKCGSHSEPFD